MKKKRYSKHNINKKLHNIHTKRKHKGKKKLSKTKKMKKRKQHGSGSSKWKLLKTSLQFTSVLRDLIEQHLHPIEGLYVLQMNDDDNIDISDLIRVGTSKGVPYGEMQNKLSSVTAPNSNNAYGENKIGNGIVEILEENAKRFENNSSNNKTKFDKLRFLFPDQFQLKDNSYTCIIYKYQDPVVRMTCEYTMFVLKGINITKNLNFDTLCEQVFNKYVNETEGSICEFGIGMTTCCSSNMVKFIETSEDYIKDGITHLINSDIYQKMIKDENYKILKDVSSEYEQLFKAPEELINNKDMKFKIKLVQCLINKIIIKSGRGEGILPSGMERKKYPSISICEVLDKTNTIWMQRSESFHISRSPCVHAGIYGETAAQDALKLFGLDKTYENLIWIHSIGHTLDRLFCGHKHTAKVKRTNKYIWLDMMTCVQIFSRLKKVPFDTMYNTFFNVFDINYGYSNDAITSECRELKQIYKCTKMSNLDKENIDDYIENDPIIKQYLSINIKENPRGRLALYNKSPLYIQKYIDWLWKSENFKNYDYFYQNKK